MAELAAPADDNLYSLVCCVFVTVWAHKDGVRINPSKINSRKYVSVVPTTGVRSCKGSRLELAPV